VQQLVLAVSALVAVRVWWYH